MFLGISLSDLSAIATCGLFVVAALAGLVALQQVREARRLRLEQTQPYVTVYGESPNWAFAYLVVKNFGRTAAYDIEITFDPELLRFAGAGTEPGKKEPVKLHEPVKVPKPIPMLAPGQEWRAFWDVAIRGDDQPTHYRANITFRDSRDTAYKTRSALDWDMTTDRGKLDELEEDPTLGDPMRGIVRQLGSISRTLEAWTEKGGDGH